VGGCVLTGSKEVEGKNMMRARLIHTGMNFAGLLFAVTAVAQSIGGADPHSSSPSGTITTSVAVVTTPATVRAHNGKFVSDLQVQDFEVYDNNRLQKITADLRDSPFSMVIAIQRSADMTGLLPKVQRIGPALTDLVAGRDAEIAVVGFDDRVRIEQAFTEDSGKVCDAIDAMRTGSYSHAVIDAVMESVQMLRSAPRDRRRVVLVVAEKWDKGSHASLREAVLEAQLRNVTVYSLNVSTAVAELTSEPKPQRPPPVPTTAQILPSNAPLTPTTISQNYYLGNWAPVVANGIYAVKDQFSDNTLEVFTRSTGGEGYSFHGQRSLDKALQSLTEDLHTQYVLSYSPNNLNQGGFHEIRVDVKRPGLVVRTRPGYWIGGKPD
jgi:VWFA-related protein